MTDRKTTKNMQSENLSWSNRNTYIDAVVWFKGELVSSEFWTGSSTSVVFLICS